VMLGGSKVTDTGHRVLGFNTSGATGFVDGHQVNQMLTLLGDYNVRLFMPPMESTLAITDPVQDMGPRGQHGQAMIAFDYPCVNRGNIMAWRFNGVDEYLEVPDNDLFSFGDSLVDQPFSVGCWWKCSDTAVTAYLLSKYDSVSPLREWAFAMTSTNRVHLVIRDQSVIGAERGRMCPVLNDFTWYFTAATYNGVGGADAHLGIRIYQGSRDSWLGRTDVADANGGGVYVAMENLAQPVMIGAADTVAGPNPGGFFPGEMCLAFIVGGELPAGVVERVYRLGVEVMQL